tara:strand:- start:630 stop:776 length:147 start_codon:yes stop_codon:yes gene_type:complete
LLFNSANEDRINVNAEKHNIGKTINIKPIPEALAAEAAVSDSIGDKKT